MQSSIWPKIQEQLDSIGPQIIAANSVQLTEHIIETHRLIRDDVSPLLRRLSCDQKKHFELMPRALDLKHQSKGSGMAQGSEARASKQLSSSANPHIVIPRPLGKEKRNQRVEADSSCQFHNQETLARLIAKPSQLKEMCQIIDVQASKARLNDVAAVNSISNFRSSSTVGAKKSGDFDSIKPLRLNCLCQKHWFKQQKVTVMASWVFSSEISNVEYHLPDCPFRSCVTSAKQTRWEIRFAGLRGLINCAVGLSFSTSFGAGGFSLSPSFTYYPSVNSSTAPVFRILDLLRWFFKLLPFPVETATEALASTLLGFIDICIANIFRLYMDGKAAPQAIDELGRSAMHHLSRTQVRHQCEEWIS